MAYCEHMTFEETMPDGTVRRSVAIVRFSGRRPVPPRCHECGATCVEGDTFQCDFPVTERPHRKKKKWDDCDRFLCGRCTQKGASGKTDFCKEHFPLALAAHLRREAEKNSLGLASDCKLQ